MLGWMWECMEAFTDMRERFISICKNLSFLFLQPFISFHPLFSSFTHISCNNPFFSFLFYFSLKNRSAHFHFHVRPVKCLFFWQNLERSYFYLNCIIAFPVLFLNKQIYLTLLTLCKHTLAAGNPEPPDQLEGPWLNWLRRVGSRRNISSAASEKWKNPLFVWQATAHHQETRRNLHVQSSHPG